MNKLEEIHDKVQNAKEKKARLYFVTRKIKKGMTRSAKVADKYEYKAWSIDTDLEIQSELYKVFDIKLGNISDENKFTISDYTLIGDDDSKKILTYSKKEKLTSFMKIVDVDLINAATLDHVVNLTEIADDIWAYIIEVVSGKKTIWSLLKNK